MKGSDNPVIGNCLKVEITVQTFYPWKKTYVGMGMAEVRKLKAFR